MIIFGLILGLIVWLFSTFSQFFSLMKFSLFKSLSIWYISKFVLYKEGLNHRNMDFSIRKSICSPHRPVLASIELRHPGPSWEESFGHLFPRPGYVAHRLHPKEHREDTRFSDGSDSGTMSTITEAPGLLVPGRSGSRGWRRWLNSAW